MADLRWSWFVSSETSSRQPRRKARPGMGPSQTAEFPLAHANGPAKKSGRPLSERPNLPAGSLMLRKTYDWVMSLAGSRHAPVALAAVSFAESSFFPVPPDVMLAPMVLARPDKAFRY